MLSTCKHPGDLQIPLIFTCIPACRYYSNIAFILQQRLSLDKTVVDGSTHLVLRYVRKTSGSSSEPVTAFMSSSPLPYNDPTCRTKRQHGFVYGIRVHGGGEGEGGPHPSIGGNDRPRATPTSKWH